MANALENAFAKMQFGAKQRLRTYRKISTMTRYGLPLNRVLDMLWEQASKGGQKPDEPMAVIMDSWRIAIRNGRPLSVAAGSWVPFNERMMIEAGEESQNLSIALNNLIAVNKAGSDMRSAVISGLAYPVVLILAVCAVLWLFGTRVIPTFEIILPSDQWVGTAASLAGMSEWVQVWMLPVIGIILGIVALISYSMPRLTGPVRKYLDKIPPWSLYRIVSGAGFMLSMGALVSAGVQTARALEKLKRNASPWLKERLEATLKHVYSGANMGRALQRAGYGYPDEEIIDDLIAYSDLPAFSEMLDTLGKEWVEDSVELIKTQARILNTIALLLMAGTVAWIFSGMFAIQQQISAAVQM